MKKLWILALSLLIIVALVACDDQTPDAESTADTTVVSDAQTEAQTEAFETQAETMADTLPQETTEPAETIDAAYALDKILDSQKELIPLEGDWAIDLDMVLDMATNVNGMNTTISMEMGMGYMVDQESGMMMSWQIPTMDDMALVYTNDTLYVNTPESKFYSNISLEEFQAMLGELMGGFGLGDDIPTDENTEAETTQEVTPSTPTLPESNPLEGIQNMIAMIRPSALFAEVGGELGEDGSYIITVKGLSEQANSIVDMILASASTPDNSAESTITMDALLEMFNMDNVTLTFVADKAYELQSVSVATKVDMSMIYGYEADNQMLADMTMTLAIDRNNQTVTAPADKDTYIEKHWREIFGMETAEMLGLVADENNVIVLASQDIEKLDKQLTYIGEHLEAFATVTFSVDALFNDISSYDMSDFSDLEMTAHIMGVIVPTESEEEIPTYIDIYVPAEMVEGVTFEEGSSVTATFTLVQGDISQAFFDNFIYFQLVTCTAKA